MIFIDTNLFLRFLLKDNLSQHKQAEKLLLRGAKEEVKLFTSVIVIFEVYWVLKSVYKKDRRELVKELRQILDLKFIQLDYRESLTLAVEHYSTTRFNLPDSFNLFYAKKNNADKFATFDEKLQKAFAKLESNGME
ncbi:MAG: PilT protein domain-containing protein [Microgenomates group bacterium Gr01-1014_5]|nr:MAG: PilT protein domain-containing protein [Microgenomates group bacterium Gr01-1014_5]